MHHTTAFVALAASLSLSGCGARSGLPGSGAASEEPVSVPPVTAAYCAAAEYRSGYASLGLFVLLDRSASMLDDNKWSQATVALSSFVHAPQAAGLEVGLSYFPFGKDVCDVVGYTIPQVPMGPLPANADAVDQSLAEHYPGIGETPTLPAIRGAIEYVRSLVLADPSRSIVLALVTDGSPNACDSTTRKVAIAAGQGASAEPQVLTFVIGLESGFVEDMQAIAEAGGTGDPIFVGKSEGSVQRLMEALKFLRDTQLSCSYAIPKPGAPFLAGDIRVGSRPGASAGWGDVSPVLGASDCSTGPRGYYLDDPQSPTRVKLCPVLCDELRQSPGSAVQVTVGCGTGAPDGGPPADAGPTEGGGICSGVVGFACFDACDSPVEKQPICVQGEWVCPAGTISTDQCEACPVVPHGCCASDGTISQAFCVAQKWECPPGAPMFGEPGCTAPEACAPTLACPPGMLCVAPDYLCGASKLAGHCEPTPVGCPGTSAPVCGCDGKVHPSACEAASVHVDLAGAGDCAVPAGTFACGPLFCPQAGHVCRLTQDYTAVPSRQSYACAPLPAGCSDGCGCGLCDPCPDGNNCTEGCYTQESGPVLQCNLL